MSLVECVTQNGHYVNVEPCRGARTLENSRACEKLGTAYSVPRRPDRSEKTHFPFAAAWTERAVPIFSPPSTRAGVFIPIVMRNAMGTLVRMPRDCRDLRRTTLRREPLALHLGSAPQKFEPHAPSLTGLASVHFDWFEFPLPDGLQRKVGEIAAAARALYFRVGHRAGRIDIHPDSQLDSAADGVAAGGWRLGLPLEMRASVSPDRPRCVRHP